MREKTNKENKPLKKTFRKLALGIAGALFVLLLTSLIAASSFFVWLTGENGRDWLSGQIEHMELASGIGLDVGKIKSFDTGHLSVDYLSLQDAKGKFLEINELYISYRMPQLLKGNIWLDRFEIGRISLNRMPENTNKNENSKENLAAIQGIEIPDLHIGSINLIDINIGKSVTGKEEKLSLVDGKLILSPKIECSEISLTLKDKNSNETEAGKLLVIEFVPLTDQNHLALKIRSRDNGSGPVSRISGISPINIDINGDGAAKNWHGTANVQIGSFLSVNEDIFVNAGKTEYELTTKGDRISGNIKTSGTTSLKYIPKNGDMKGDFSGDLYLLGLPDEFNNSFPANIKAEKNNRTISFSAEIKGEEELSLKANGEIPVVRRKLPGMNSRIKGEIKASSNIAMLSLVAGLDEFKTGGQIALDGTISGTISSPVINGNGKIDNGSFESLEFGSRFQRIKTSFSVKNNEFLLTEITGKDPYKGSFTANGKVSMENGNYEFGANVSMDKFHVIDTTSMGAEITGELQLHGNETASDIKGDLKLERAEYYMSRIGNGSSSYSGFTIIDKKEGDFSPVSKSHFYKIIMDVSLKAPKGIFVRGPQIESEWSGKLKVTGTLHNPKIRGKVSVIRGQIGLLDSQINLTEGNINFVNENFIDPELDINGKLRGSKTDADVKITGSAISPEITFSSSDGASQDEVLAQALFGVSASELTPVQAIKLANMLARLSGKAGNSIDPVSKIRKLTGLDTVSVGYDDDSGAAVSVGKYINDKVYVAVDQGATPESSAVRTEIKVGEGIELETKLGNTNENSLGINWKRDY